MLFRMGISKKMLGVLLGSLTFSGMVLPVHGQTPPKGAPDKKGSEKGGLKSCGGDKGCGADKDQKGGDSQAPANKGKDKGTPGGKKSCGGDKGCGAK
jgi:hypothetical protein